MKTAFLFSGQGSQTLGMGKELYDAFDSCKEILNTADRVLGFSLTDIIFGEDAEKLNRTIYSQPAILAVSLMALAAAKEKGMSCEAVAGHSLGEYAAMVASDMLTVEEAFTAIKYRSEAMEKAANENPGGMAAILGVPADKVTAICDEIKVSGSYVTAVNYNSPVQTVIAGTAEGLEKAKEKLSAEGAKRIVPLAVSAAFHSELMKGAADEFYEKVKGIEFKAPAISYYSNLYGKRLTSFADMPVYLSQHICSAVKFTDELNAMKEDGIDTYIELGPGKVLTGLVKKTLDEVTAVNVENVATLEKAAELFA